MKRHPGHGNSYKKAFNWELSYRFRGLVYYPHGGKHGDIQADMVLEK